MSDIAASYGITDRRLFDTMKGRDREWQPVPSKYSTWTPCRGHVEWPLSTDSLYDVPVLGNFGQR